MQSFVLRLHLTDLDMQSHCFIDMAEGQYQRVKLLYNNSASRVEVYEVIDTFTNAPAVLKIVRTSSLQKMNQKMQEAVLQKGLVHPNICSVFGLWLSEESGEKSINIVLEKLERDVASDINARAANKFPYTEDQLVDFLRQIGGALQFAKSNVTHMQSVAHRDIKPTNVLMALDGTYKLIDFGSAKELKDPRMIQHTLIGTMFFFSPQLRQMMAQQANTGATAQYDPYKSDVYSLGLTVTFMALLTPPHELSSLENLAAKTEMVLQKLNYSEQLKNLLRGMLQVNEANRLNIEDVTALVTPQFVEYPLQQSDGSYQLQGSQGYIQQYADVRQLEVQYPPQQYQQSQYSQLRFPESRFSYQAPQVEQKPAVYYQRHEQFIAPQASEFYQESQGYQYRSTASQQGVNRYREYRQYSDYHEKPATQQVSARRSQESSHDDTRCVQCKCKLRPDVAYLQRHLPCSAITCSQICLDKILNCRKPACPKCTDPLDPNHYK